MGEKGTTYADQLFAVDANNVVNRFATGRAEWLDVAFIFPCSRVRLPFSPPKNALVALKTRIVMDLRIPPEERTKQ